MDWISINDRLPSDHKDVTINSTEHGVINGYYWGKVICKNDDMVGFCSQSGDIPDGMLNDVTHWMPLPEGPKK